MNCSAISSQFVAYRTLIKNLNFILMFLKAQLESTYAVVASKSSILYSEKVIICFVS